MQCFRFTHPSHLTAEVQYLIAMYIMFYKKIYYFISLGGFHNPLHYIHHYSWSTCLNCHVTHVKNIPPGWPHVLILSWIHYRTNVHIFLENIHPLTPVTPTCRPHVLMLSWIHYGTNLHILLENIHTLTAVTPTRPRFKFIITNSIHTELT